MLLQLREIALDNLPPADLVSQSGLDPSQGLGDRLVLLLEPLESPVDLIEVPELIVSQLGELAVHLGEPIVHPGEPAVDLGELTPEEMALTVRFWTMSISDFLDEYFETDVVKANFAGSGIIGTALGPMSPGSAYVLLHHYMGEVDGSVGAWGYARGGMGAVTKALADSFRASGGTIRTGAEVEQVLVRRGKATGVVLAGGDEIDAKMVISNADVKRTFLKLVEEKELPEMFLRRVKNFKIRGSSGKVNIALDSAPVFPALPEGSPSYRGDLHFTDTVERMERAYDCLLYTSPSPRD